MAFYWLVRPVAKLISTTLLLILNAVPVVYLFVFQIHQSSIRHSMEERLEEERLHTLTISKAELRWVKEGKEIVIGGELFDVKSVTEIEDGMLLVTGIYDYEESALVLHMKKSQDEEGSKGGKLIKMAQLMVAIPSADTKENLSHSRIATHWPHSQAPGLSSPFTTILTPPPQG